MTRRLLMVIALGAIVAAGCGGTADTPDEIVLLTHDSFAVSEGILEQFEAQSGVAVKVLRVGDGGAMVSQAILTRDAPLADVLYGVDNTFLSRALDADIFLSYVPAGSGELLPELDAGSRVTPINFGDVCLNYDKAALAAAGLPVPTDLRMLTEPEFAGSLVVQNPASSSPGLAFLLATVASFPEDGAYTWRDFWADLRANDVLVTPDWESAYYTEFAGGGDGRYPLVVSYASSPPVGVIFSEPQPAEAPTGVVTAGCFRQIEYAGILAGTKAEPWARELIDFMIDASFQGDMPLNMFVFPARGDVPLPAEFIEHTEIPPAPATIDPATIEENRGRWIEEWIEIMRS